MGAKSKMPSREQSPTNLSIHRFIENQQPSPASSLPPRADLPPRNEEPSTLASRLNTTDENTADVNTATRHDFQQPVGSRDTASPEPQEHHESQGSAKPSIHRDYSSHISNELERNTSYASSIPTSAIIETQTQHPLSEGSESQGDCNNSNPLSPTYSPKSSSKGRDNLGTSARTANSTERVQGGPAYILRLDESDSQARTAQTRQNHSNEEDSFQDQDEARRPSKQQKLMLVRDVPMTDSADPPISLSRASVSGTEMSVDEHETTPELSDGYSPASSPGPSLPDTLPASEYREYPFSGIFKCTTIGDKNYCSLEFTTSRTSGSPDISELMKPFGRDVSETPRVTKKATPNPRKWTRRARYTWEEDQRIIRLKEDKKLPWSKIAEQFPRRSEKGLKLRYSTLCQGASKKTTSIRTRRRRNSDQVRDESPQSSDDNNDEFDVEKIEGHRLTGDGVMEYDVVWDGGAHTWEPHTAMMGTMALEAYLTVALAGT